MPDPRREAIARALRERQLDGRLFERCAVDLLRDAWYPDLRGTPHGRDAGVDGISGPDADPGFVLAATTAKDYGRNLRESVKSHLGGGGHGRAFVLATTREVAVERRLRLENELDERWNVRLLAVHDRGDFERLLYGSPRWSKDLLGVAGAEAALSRFPVRSRPAFPILPIGRDADLERLRAAEGDLVLTGKPGAGKTFLLERLADEGWCLFDAGRDTGELADAVREMRPRRVALDDAHLATDRLAEVLHVREETGSDFRIAAVSWPGRAGEVAALLPDAERILVDELERDRIVELIEAAGVAGPVGLQRLIADQARGLPGLAAALARACVSGRVREVASGEELLADLARWYERVLGKESLQALGALALAGDRGATLEQVKGILDMNRAEAGNLIRGLADGGAIDEAEGRRLRVQPGTLRYALVGNVFFGGPGSLDAFRAAGRLDDPSIAALPLIGAALRGASVDRGRLQELVDWADGRAAGAYACLGADELRTALDRAPAHRTGIAGAAYMANAGPERALRVLMEQAAEGNAADDPLRIVGDRLARPGAGPEARLPAAGVADAWLRDGGDARAGLRVLLYAVNPAWGDFSIDPGLGTEWTDRKGVVPAEWIGDLDRVWDLILGIAERERSGIPVDGILDALGAWARPGRVGEPGGPDAETAGAMRRVAGRAAERLADIFGERPGVLLRLRRYAELGDLPVRIDAPDWFARLFPERGSIEEYVRGETFVRRAEELAGLPAADIADHLMLVDREAILAGIESPAEMLPRGARRLAREIAARDERPENLLEELDRRGADSGLLGWFLDRAAELRRPGWEKTAKRLLDREAASAAAVRTALVRPAGERLKRLAIGKAATELGLIESLAVRGEIGQATLALLFEAADPAVARTAALALDAGRIARLPRRTAGRWKEIVVSAPPDGGGGPSGGWSLAQILKRDRELCASWLRAWFARLREHDSGTGAVPERELLEAIEGLSPDVRASLAGDMPANDSSFLLSGVVRSLVADDLAVAETLFGRTDLGHLWFFVLAAMDGGLSEALMDRAVLAASRGLSPEDVVRCICSSIWDGPGSLHWRRFRDAFEGFRPAPGQPDADLRASIVDAGVSYCENEIAYHARRERDERIYGRKALPGL